MPFGRVRELSRDKVKNLGFDVDTFYETDSIAAGFIEYDLIVFGSSTTTYKEIDTIRQYDSDNTYATFADGLVKISRYWSRYIFARV